MAPAISQRRVVITGGPCSGKSTMIEGLAKRGFRTVPEAAIQVIQELAWRLGLEEQARWRAKEPRSFQKMILERQRRMEAKIPEQPLWVFLDRGVHDGLAYLQHYQIPVSTELRDAYGPCVYHRVFILDTLKGFDGRVETGRTEDRAEAVQIRDRLRAIYEEQGIQTDIVPEMPLVEREEWVLRVLNAPISAGSSVD